MAAEKRALVNAFHNGYIVYEALVEMMRRRIDIEDFLNSCSRFNVIARGSNTAEGSLQIGFLLFERNV